MIKIKTWSIKADEIIYDEKENKYKYESNERNSKSISIQKIEEIHDYKEKGYVLKKMELIEQKNSDIKKYIRTVIIPKENIEELDVIGAIMEEFINMPYRPEIKFVGAFRLKLDKNIHEEAFNKTQELEKNNENEEYIKE